MLFIATIFSIYVKNTVRDRWKRDMSIHAVVEYGKSFSRDYRYNHMVCWVYITYRGWVLAPVGGGEMIGSFSPHPVSIRGINNGSSVSI